MEVLIILALVGAVGWLMNQVRDLKRRLELLEDRLLASDQSDAASAPPSVTIVSSEQPAGTIRSEPLERPTEPEAPDSQPEPVPDTDEVPASLPGSVPASPERAQDDAFFSDADESEKEAEPARKPRFDIEDIFGRKLPIWVGGITLAIAGILLVRYSIEAGLVTPSVRVAMAFVFGLGLLAGAEFSYRKPDLVGDPRIRQALAGAGLATLYAGFYLAGTQYGLIGQTFAFIGLAAVTAGAIALSFRFGLPCAILGLVGGFAAPLLVGGEEANLPLLTIYLGLVTAGLSQAGNRQGRPWLSMAALVAGLGWGLLLLLAEDFGTAEVLALGIYLVTLGAVLPALMAGGSFVRPVRLASAFLASLQLALLVDRAGDGALAWGLYLLMGAALAALAWTRRELREASAVAMVIAVGLLTQYGLPITPIFHVIAASVAAIFMVIPLVHIARQPAELADFGKVAAGPIALAAGIYAVTGQPAADIVEPLPALWCLALAAIPATGTWLIRADQSRTVWFASLSASAILLLFGGALLVTPSWISPVFAALALAGAVALTHRRTDRPPGILAAGFASLAVIVLLVSNGTASEILRLSAGNDDGVDLRAMLRWCSVFAALALWAWRARQPIARTAQGIAAAAGYGLIAQILPDSVLPWAVAVAAAGLSAARFDSFAGRAVLVAICALWALGPVADWLATGMEAAAGLAPLAFDWPDWRTGLLKILPFAVAALALKRGLKLPSSVPANLPAYLAAATLLIVLHIVFKHLFNIETRTAFVEQALAERTLWQAILLAIAIALSRPLPRIGAQPMLRTAVAALSLAHFAWFTGGVHNPLLTAQAVGPVPIANLALAAGTVALAATWIIRRATVGRAQVRLRQALDAVAMIIVVAVALALLRQMFAGSVLTSQPLGQSEDLLRSLLGIVLAIAFLIAGRMRDEQSWRIGSLVLMVLAVAKVFLVDAAALEGLLRIASFMALGFSLLGIGWLYARQLGTRKTAAEDEGQAG
ncbi:DUF2339 domain-containing protein [Altererythrobacter sp. MTPC7]|uniref:DUF2339 domain-containing protein n=1 Tax=Altererythrobacter sp. MTPC7 TaxID=3056567 RepID=UPI0036F448AF